MARRTRTNRKRRPLKERLGSAWGFTRSAVKRTVPLLVLAAVTVAVPYGAHLAYQHVVSTPYFAVKRVEISGLQQLDEAQIRQAAGLTDGVNAFDVDVEASRLAIESEPWVRSARVEKRLPDRVIVHVEERTAAGVLVTGDVYVLLDSSGEPFKVFETSDDPALLDLPLVTGLSRAEAEDELGQQLVIEALDVVRLAREAGVGGLSEVHIDRVLGLSIVPAETGTEVRLGRGRYKERLDRLRAVLTAVEREGRQADYILVDSQDNLNRVTVGTRAGELDADLRN